MAVDSIARAAAATRAIITAYQYAVAAGYTGTEDDFQSDMGDLADNMADVTFVLNVVNGDLATYSTSGMNAPADISKGEYVFANGTIYRALSNIDSGTTLTPDTNVVAVTVGGELTNLAKASESIPQKTAILSGETNIPIPFDVDGPGYIKSDGTIATATILAPTDYIPITEYFSLSFKRYGSMSSSSSVKAAAFYDATKTMITTVDALTSQAATGYGATLETVSLPVGAAYARFTTFIDTETYGAFEVYGNTTVIGSGIEDALNSAANVGGVGRIALTHGATITNNSTVDLTAITPVPTKNGYSCGVIDCKAGEVFTISGTGGSTTAMLWAFFDNTGANLAKSKINEYRNLEQITAPTGAVKLIVNGKGLIVWRGIPVNESITGGPYPPNTETVAISIVAGKRMATTKIGDVLTLSDNTGFAYFVTAVSAGEHYSIKTYSGSGTDGRYYVYATDASDVVITRTFCPDEEGNLPIGSYTFDYTIPDGVSKLWVQAAASANNASSRLGLWKHTPRPIRQVLENALTPIVSDTMTAPSNITAGEYVLAEGTLYRATANIASGATLTVGTNVAAVTVGGDLATLQAKIPDAPTTDGTYTLKATVSGGTPTFSWVADI